MGNLLLARRLLLMVGSIYTLIIMTSILVLRIPTGVATLTTMKMTRIIPIVANVKSGYSGTILGQMTMTEPIVITATRPKYLYM